MTANLLVVGLDLVTGREVHAGDRRTEEWYKKGHNGDRTLVCLACYQGADLPDGPRTVALVPKGRDGGARQQHFAHPPGMVPPGGKHSPESLWHAEGKQAIRELFAVDKARLGDVFYDSVAARADPLIDQWKRETVQEEEA